MALGCSAILGIDGQYDDADESDAALGGAGGSTSGGAGGSTFGGAGGTGAVTSGGGTTSGGGGATSGENCANSVDDDGDGAIDCADTDCQSAGFVCAPALPGNFKGPFVFGQAPGLGACPGTHPAQVIEGGDALSAPPASCVGVSCKCGPPPAVSCSPVVVDYFGDVACSGAPKWSKSGATNTCTSGNFVHCSSGCAYPTAAIVDLGTPLASSTCASSFTGTPTLPPVGWNTPGRLCSPAAASQGGCGSGTCLQKAAAPFQRLCISAAGNLSCPSPYTAKSTLKAVSSDTRSCSCDCTPDFTCTGTVKDYYGSVCTAAGTTLSNSCTPVEVSNAVSSETRYLLVTNHGGIGNCIPSSPSAAGTVTATSAFTVCCLP